MLGDKLRGAECLDYCAQVYVDQIASYYPEFCYGQNHSGGGSRWADGNRQTLKGAVEAVGKGNVLISESNAEAYLGSLHAYLALYGFRQCNFVPAFQAIYGGCVRLTPNNVPLVHM